MKMKVLYMSFRPSLRAISKTSRYWMVWSECT